MIGKIKTLANIFIIIGFFLGVITFFEVFNLDLLNFSMHWIVFLILIFLVILFLILGVSLRIVYKQTSDEIKSIYKYYDKKLRDIENVK